MSTDNKVIVIGSGIAGMACAARLAFKGYDVTVIERNITHGGKLGHLHQDGYSFDTGPSLFTQPYIFEDLFSYCGKQFKDYVTYRKLDINTEYFFDDGMHLSAYQEHEKLFTEIKQKLGIEPYALEQFLKDAEICYNRIGKIFLDEPIHQLKTWLSKNIPNALAAVKYDYLFSSMHAYHNKKLKHPKLVQLFDRFATYNGSNPYTAPAMLSMIAHLEMNEGAYYPQGGMISLSNAVYQLCIDLDVQFRFATQVQEILLEKNTVKGIRTNEEVIYAEHVISNSDVYFTYRDLLKNDKQAQAIKQQERSSSGLIFYWGIKKEFKQLGLHNIFFAKDYKLEFDTIFRKHKVHDDPTVYINITSKEEPTHAPEGCENWFVLINTPTSDKLKDKQWVEDARKNIITKLNNVLHTDVNQLIATEAILTPELIEKNTGSYLGALYGTSSNATMSAFNRHPNHSKKYKGLYFAGGTVHPGGGIPLCLRSAKLAADRIIKH